MKRLFLLSLLMVAGLQAKVAKYAISAAKRPIVFSVVREDSLGDLEIIKGFFPEEKVSMLMVASGGGTAAHLIAQAPLKDLTLVDPNAVQLDLARLKIQLLTLPTKKRLEILGYLPMDPVERKNIMQGYMLALGIDTTTFGDLSTVAIKGIDNEGRYEKVFEELRRRLIPYKKDIEKLFSLRTIKEQSQHVAPTTRFGKALDKAFDKVMSQENLVKIFGPKATANRVQDFSHHFAQRTRAYLENHLASESPWLASMLLGNFHNDCMFPWLGVTSSQPMPKVSYYHGFMNDALRHSEPERYHVIHLSNIIDWLSPEEAKKTLALAYHALKPGGVVVIRQLNSSVDIPQLGNQFEWDLKASKKFLDNDRSFFYKNFFLGFKPKDPIAPKVTQLADDILKETPIIEGAFFNDLPKMDKEVFKKAQAQFFFAVDYFSRPMAALIARMPLHKDRIDILHNIVEEHGNFSVDQYHSTSFKQFLGTIGVPQAYLQKLKQSPVVQMFNFTLMGVCANEDPLLAIACDGIIEYAFADISALIAQRLVERRWVKKEKLIHYNLHANLDKQHAAEFFQLLEPYMDNSKQKEKIISGLRLGAYIFNRLYEDLYQEAKK